MNIFVLDLNPRRCAEYHCDKHVVKMILEHAQLLSTCCRFYGLDIGYKSTHVNHPCSLWVRESLANWEWLFDMSKYLNQEYQYRFDKKASHKSYDLISQLYPPLDLPDIDLTPFALAMPDTAKVKNDPVASYRNYYRQHKTNIATWKKRNTPKWFLSDSIYANSSNSRTPLIEQVTSVRVKNVYSTPKVSHRLFS